MSTTTNLKNLNIFRNTPKHQDIENNNQNLDDSETNNMSKIKYYLCFCVSTTAIVFFTTMYFITKT